MSSGETMLSRIPGIFLEVDFCWQHVVVSSPPLQDWHLPRRQGSSHTCRYFILPVKARAGKMKSHLLMGLSTTTCEGPGWQIRSKTPGFTTGLPALQLEPEADLSGNYTYTNDNNVGNVVLSYRPFPQNKTTDVTSLPCTGWPVQRKMSWTRAKALTRLHPALGPCQTPGCAPGGSLQRCARHNKEIQAWIKTPRGGCRWNYIVYFYLCFNELILSLLVFLIFCCYEWLNGCVGGKNTLGGLLKLSCKGIRVAVFGAENKIIQK